MLKHERTHSQYTIPVDLKCVMDIESEQENNGDWDNHLNDHLDKIEGVSDTDYNGHFGNIVFVNVLAEFDNDKTWDDIEATINNFMKG